MMTTRLQRALQRIDEVSPEQQDEIAALIEDALAPYLDLPSYAGSLAGLLPDDAEEQLLQLRRASPPSPPIEDQLRGLMEDQEDQA
ncbi:MAG: hypothetical protein OJF49_002831 [Ktedonobacterales bacterium]|nr:MAG: hypothetical protein OJF49_002831 [Ktedonobacterales bacterium]